MMGQRRVPPSTGYGSEQSKTRREERRVEGNVQTREGSARQRMHMGKYMLGDRTGASDAPEESEKARAIPTPA